jgi:hypothetical protein
MPRAWILRYAVLSTLVIALVGAGAEPAVAGGFSFASCRDIHAVAPSAPDGDYVLFTDDTVLTVYCHDMAGTPREYISLVGTGPDQNFSQYTAGVASRGTDVRTRYTKVRIDPGTLLVDIGDTTFATSTGSLTHSNSGTTVTTMPYGEAMSCTARPDGIGNIDLRGTPFTVTDPFIVRGYPAPVGSATFSDDNQVVALRAGAYCGWISAAPEGPPYNTTPGDFRLDLACAGKNVVVARHQFCVTRPALRLPLGIHL